MFKGLRERLGGALDLQRFVYETQKLKLRATRLIEGIERLTGARPGPGLQIELRGSKTLEDAIRRAGRRIALAFAGGAALLAAVLAAAADRSTPGCRSRSASPPARRNRARARPDARR